MVELVRKNIRFDALFPRIGKILFKPLCERRQFVRLQFAHGRFQFQQIRESLPSSKGEQD